MTKLTTTLFAVLLGLAASACTFSGNCQITADTWECKGTYVAPDGFVYPLPGPDAGAAVDAPAVDAPVDAPVIVDAAPAMPDAAAPPLDTRPPAPDLAPDSAPVVPDAAPPIPDAAPVPADARPAPSGMRVGTQLWQLGWMDPSYSFVTNANFAGAASVWQPALVSDLAQYTGALRSMDAVATNNTQAATWAQRTAKTAGIDAQTSDNGVAWEWWIDLCNRAHRDCWFNVPYKTASGRAINDYAVALATLVKATLDPSLKAYFEYSNEAWNGQFPTLAYTLAQGQALKLDTDLYSNAYRYYAVASAGVFNAAESVFGKNNPRVVKVLGGQRDNAWLVGVHADQIRKEGQSADAYAVAPYFNGTSITTMQTDMNLMIDDPKSADDLTAVVAAVKQNGMALACYEGGQENYTNAAVLNRDPGMYGLYTTFLSRLADMGFQDCALYLHVSPYSAGGAWGVRESLSTPLSSSPKWRAILDWEAVHP